MKKLLTSLSLLAITLLANAYDAEVDGIYYNLDPGKRVAEVTYQYLPIGEINWTSDARFGLDGSDMDYACAATFPQDIWERMRSGTFFVTVRGDYPQIRVTSGWWETVWTGGDIDPGNERLAANGDGTWTLAVNLAGDPLADVIDAHDLLITGGGYTLENIYLVETNSGGEPGDEEMLFLWKNEPYHLEAVNIPEKVTYNGVEYTVTGIGAKAFRNCGNLATLTIPNSVTDIGSNSFQGCSGLTSLTYTNSVTNIGSYAFSGCSSLSSLTIPKSVTAIGYSAFEGCIGLTSIKVESGNTVYDSRENCNAIIETGTNTLFAGCKSSIIPNSVTIIGNGAFYNCRSLTSITIPNSVTTIGNSAFANCSGLASLAIPNSVTTIGNSAFAYCRSLTSLTIPNSVDFIAGSAFEGCSGLASVTIPNSVTNIGNVAFYGCSGLTEVTSLIEEPFTIDKYVWFGVNTDEIPLYVPAGCKAKYEATEGWNVFKNIVEMGASSSIAIDETNFPDKYFRNWVLAQEYGQDGVLTEDEIAGVTNIKIVRKNISNFIGIEYFTALTRLDVILCRQLTSLDVSKNTALRELICYSNSLTSLDVSKNTELTLLNCHENQLTSLVLPKNGALKELECYKNQIEGTAMDALIASLPETGGKLYAIMPGDNEKNVVTMEQVAAAKEKGWKTYYYSDDDGWVDYKIIPEGNIDFADPAVKALCVANWDTDGDGELSYYEAAAIKDLGKVFNHNQEIESFNELRYFIGLKTIGDEAFEGCGNLVSIELPEGLDRINSYAFYGCNIQSLYIPSTVTYIGSYAFNQNRNLMEIKVSENNSRFDSRNDCNAIIATPYDKLVQGCNSTIIPDGVKELEWGAFEGLSSLKKIVIPEGVTLLGEYTFYGCSALEEISIPSTVTMHGIKKTTFYDCLNLKTIRCYLKVPFSLSSEYAGPFGSNYQPEDKVYDQATLYVRHGAKAMYKETEGWSKFKNIVEMAEVEDDELQDGDLFIGKTIEGIEVTYKVISATDKTCQVGIGWQPWVYIVTATGTGGSRQPIPAIKTTTEGAITISEQVLGFRVVKVGGDAFNDCDKLTSISLPDCITEIGQDAMYGCHELTEITLPSGLDKIESGTFEFCYNMSSIIIPNSVTEIGNSAFYKCSSLSSITIPKSVISIKDQAFGDCKGLTSVISLIEEPFKIYDNVFSYYDDNGYSCFTTATLYVPAGTKEKYEVIPAWNKFQNIVEMDIAPVDEGQTIDIGNEIDENTNLEGTVVDNVFVNISNGDGGFDPVEKCIIVNRPTDDSAIDGKDIFGDDFKDNYTGIVFKVNEGKGSIKVEAETQGNMVLKVKIGNSEPIEMELDGKLKVKFPYNVSEPTYVYIYGGMGAAGAKATGARRAPSATDLLKIYGFEVVSDQTGIEKIDNKESKLSDAPIYNLNGQRVNTPSKGVYIKNGRKVIVK